MTSDRRIEKEDINSYIVKKREMFLVQYSLGVKRDEISKLEEIAKVMYLIITVCICILKDGLIWI